MRALTTFAACVAVYILIGLGLATAWRRRHGPLSRGQAAVLVLGWPVVVLMVLTDETDGRWW